MPETSNVVLPLTAGVGVKTSGFGIRVHPITGETKLHTGVDYSAPTGTPILATADGRVYFAGASAGYGHIILIDHTVNGQRVSSGYAHMFGERSYVNAGDPVTAGSTSPTSACPATRPARTCISRSVPEVAGLLLSTPSRGC